MKIRGLISVATAVMSVLLAVPAAGSQDPAGAEKPREVRGEVVELRQTVRTGNQAAFTEIKVRTRQQEESWFRLGPASEYGNRFRSGDRVRARILGETGGRGEPALVRTISNQRTGERLKVRSADGALLKVMDRDRRRDGTGSLDRDRDRAGQRDRSGVSRPSPGRGGHGSGGGR